MRNYVGWIFSPFFLTHSPFCISLATGAGERRPDAPTLQNRGRGGGAQGALTLPAAPV